MKRTQFWCKHNFRVVINDENKFSERKKKRKQRKKRKKEKGKGKREKGKGKERKPDTHRDTHTLNEAEKGYIATLLLFLVFIPSQYN